MPLDPKDVDETATRAPRPTHHLPVRRRQEAAPEATPHLQKQTVGVRTDDGATVKQLIALLQTLPSDATVVLEGCDCTGWWSGSIEIEDGAILLERNT
jgi:hypothetical protein